MTPEEWKDRCAKRYIERAGVSLDIARQMAEACFKAEQEASEDPFSLTEEYLPEECADNDMSEATTSIRPAPTNEEANR